MFLKRIKHFIESRRFFLTLVLYFVSFLTPVLIVGIMAYNNTTQVVRQEFERKVQQNLSNAADTIDEYLISSHSVAIAFLGDDMVKKYFVPDQVADIEQKSERWRLSKVLERYQNITSNYIDSIFAYFPGDSLVYLPTGGIDQSIFFQRVQIYESYDMDFWMDLDLEKTVQEYPADVLTNYAGLNSRIVCPWVRISNINGYTAVVVINISMEQIGKMLDNISVIDSTQYLVMGKSGEIVWNTTEITEKDGKWEELTGLFESSEENITGFHYIKINGQKYFVSKAVSSQFSWQLYSLVPLEGVNNFTSGIPKITLIVCLVLTAGGIILALFFSKRIYSPIKSTVDTLKGQEDEFICYQDEKGKNELGLLRLRVDRLVESQVRYKNQMNQYGKEYLESAFRLLLSGANLVKKDMLNQIMIQKMGFQEPNFMVCCICFKFHSNYYKELTEFQRQNVAEKLRTILVSLFEEEIKCYVMEPRQNIYTCLLNCQEKSQIGEESKVFCRMEDVLRYDKQYFDVVVGMGGLSYGIDGIRDSYHQAITEVQNSQAGVFFQVHCYRAVSIPSSFQLLLESQKKMMNSLKSGNCEQLQAIVDDLLDQSVKAGIPYEYYRYLYHQIMMVGVTFLSEQGKYLSDLTMADEAEQVLFEMKIPENPEVSRRLLKSFFHEVMELCANATPPKSATLILVQEVQDYVKDHFDQQLGLEQIADQIGVSVKYVSRAFKQRTGKNLTEYINEMRIAKAKELLINTEYKIGEIAAFVGIDNRTTFLRIFKKYEGISPVEFRSIRRTNHSVIKLEASQKAPEKDEDNAIEASILYQE